MIAVINPVYQVLLALWDVVRAAWAKYMTEKRKVRATGFLFLTAVFFAVLRLLTTDAFWKSFFF